MPAISVDTFFACSLMVLLALSAMAGTSKLLYPYVDNAADENVAERYREISRYLLLNDGTPADWGQGGQTIPAAFGLARIGSEIPYELDINKVSRLSSASLYALNYADIFTAFEMPDTAFRIEVKPLFTANINLSSTFELANETTYQFEILTEKHGIPVQVELKCYVVAENYLDSSLALASDGKISVNVTLPNDINGPALLVALARSAYDVRIASFSGYAFAHNAREPSARSTFLRLSPLNYSFTASFLYSPANLSSAYALSFSHNSTLTQIANSNESASYQIPRFKDASPTLIVVTGWNATAFFTEWTAYPLVPVQMGADFAGSVARSDVFAYTYMVTINSVIYESTVWLGGPRE